jgi:hypothetical protein
VFRFPGQKVKPPRLDWSERGGRGGVWVRAYIYAAHERGEPEKVGEKFRRSCCHAHGRSSFLLTTTVGVDFFCSFFSFALPWHLRNYRAAPGKMAASQRRTDRAACGGRGGCESRSRGSLSDDRCACASGCFGFRRRAAATAMLLRLPCLNSEMWRAGGRWPGSTVR